MKRQSGFTLIELIIVIVILGILAVTAAPQFFNFGADARASTVRGMEGSVRAAADLVYARAAIEGKEREGADENNTDNTVSIGSDGQGASVAIAYGYPTAAGLKNALNINLDEADWVFSNEPTDTVTITPANFEGDDCQVVYEQASKAGARPKITTEVDGC